MSKFAILLLTSSFICSPYQAYAMFPENHSDYTGVEFSAQGSSSPKKEFDFNKLRYSKSLGQLARSLKELEKNENFINTPMGKNFLDLLECDPFSKLRTEKTNKRESPETLKKKNFFSWCYYMMAKVYDLEATRDNNHASKL